MERVDLRMPVLGVAAWVGGLTGSLLPPRVGLALVVGGALVAGLRRSRTLAAVVLVLGAVAACAFLRHTQLERSPVAALAAERASVVAVGVVASDARATHGFEEGVFFRVSLREVAGRGTTYALRAPVLVFAGLTWTDVRLGSRVRLSGRLSPAEGSD
ncbi:MAG TPA: DUF4131 domain-containing protein, partial [Nocardioides sp.]|nr:DUF4131 domain-containing protein [Nocardioides sp.]